jgi:outer membrane protein TolC
MNKQILMFVAAALLVTAGPVAGQDLVPVGLEDAVEQAREGNPSVVAARHRASAASNQIRAQGASRWPVIH